MITNGTLLIFLLFNCCMTLLFYLSIQDRLEKIKKSLQEKTEVYK